MAKPLNVFEYSIYRAFLKAWLDAAKAHKTSNLSRLAESIGVHPTFLSHVLAGDKDLSLEQASLMSEHFGFTRLEQEYFFVLIQLERAGHEKLRQYWQEKKRSIEAEKNRLSQRFDPHQQLTLEQKAIFYSSWKYAAIWSSTAIEDGQTLDEIAERFKMGRENAAEVVQFLLQSGLCSEVAAVYSIGKVHIHVPNESPLVVKHHTNWRMRAVHKMDERDVDELFFTSPMSVAKTDFAIMREKLNSLIKDVVDVAKVSKAEEVVCLNIDFFRAEK